MWLTEICIKLMSALSRLYFGSCVDCVHCVQLWMGTHPKGPSLIEPNGESLADWITSHPDSLGTNVAFSSCCQLPFLFKVLSVNIALSIQVHPDKVYYPFCFLLNWLPINHLSSISALIVMVSGELETVVDY